MKCSHCFRGESENCDIKNEYIDSLFEQTEEIGELFFTGGEPTLAIDKMKYVLCALYKNAIPVLQFGFVTNGLVFNDDIIEIIKLYSELVCLCRETIIGKELLPPIGRVFLLRKAPQFFGKVIDYINKEYGENWTHYKSQIEVNIVSRSQMKRCYDEYIAKHNDTEVSLQECRERIKTRLLKMVDSDVRRAEKKYNDVCTTIRTKYQQMFNNSAEIQALKDCGVYSEKDIEKSINNWTTGELIKSNTFTGFAPNYKDIQAEIMKFLIDTANNKQ